MRKTIASDELTGPIRQMKYSTTDPAGANYGYELSSYDPQGNLLKWEMYNELNEPRKHIIYQFDGNGVLREETLTQSDGTIVYKNTFYDNGQYRETYKYYGDDIHYGSEDALSANKPRAIKIWEYNEHHHLISQVDDDVDEEGNVRRTIFRYLFQYDEQHNWIEKTEIMNNKITGFQDRIQFIRKREIEYLP